MNVTLQICTDANVKLVPEADHISNDVMVYVSLQGNGSMILVFSTSVSYDLGMMPLDILSKLDNSF